MRVLSFSDRVEIHGKHRGVPFGVSVHPATMQTSWVEPQAAALPDSTAAASPREKCSGCGDSPLVRLAKGGVGALKALTGIGSVPLPVMQERYEICSNCPSERNVLGVCSSCECILSLKVRVGSEVCPEGHWSSHGD
jgi:hypothetical protein